MKKFSKVIAMFLFILTTSFVVPETTLPYIGVKNVEASTRLSKKSVTLIKGEKVTLKLNGVNSSKVKWYTSKSSVAIVKKGVVKTKKKGAATITAKYKNKKYTCRVIVETPKISKTSININIRSNIKLKINGTTQKVKWSSNNIKIARVTKNGNILALRVGKTTIVGKVGNKKYKCKIIIQDTKLINPPLPVVCEQVIYCTK